MRIAKTFDHYYMYSASRAEWIMVQCGCSGTARICTFPKTIRRGQMGPRVYFKSIKDADEQAYWEDLFEHAIMQLEGVEGGNQK